MQEISRQELVPAGGLCVQLPNGDPALQFITYRNAIVSTYLLDDNKVRLIVDFPEPFIRRRTTDLEREEHDEESIYNR